MNARSLVLALVFSAAMTPCIAAPKLPAGAAPPRAAQSPSGDPFPNKSITIYVADFDLDFARLAGTPPPPGNPTSRPIPPAPNAATNSGGSGASAAPNPPQAQTSAATPTAAGSRATQSDGARPDAARNDASAGDGSKADGAKPDVIQEDSPRAQAARLIDLTSRTLVKVLEQQGYTVRRMRGITTQPDRGIIIRGVYAQLDETKTLRRTVIGGAVTNPNMLIYVGIGNLSKPEQTMYTVVAPPTADNVGPAISLSVYAPIGRYEVEREPSEESVKLFANGVAADLTRLLNANSLALQQ